MTRWYQRRGHGMALGALLVSTLVVCAPAAACGLVVPAEGNAQVAQERALISWDGQTEELVMEFTLQGAARAAAWVVPTPAPATVRLAPVELFDTLQTLTQPRVVRQRAFSLFEPATDGTGGDAVGGTTPPVTVLEQQTLGPFDVTTLAAQDATALVDWLTTHDYQVPPGLATALEPYVARQWYYTAVRLTPGGAAADVPQAVLGGRLSPLAVSFASDAIIYPLRMAGLAGQPLPVFLYMLADHRVAAPTALTTGANPLQQGWLEVRSAQWLQPGALAADSPLREFVARQRFLTKFEGYLEPSSMRDDWVLPLAASDETYQAVEVQTAYISVLGVLGRGVLLLGVVAFEDGRADFSHMVAGRLAVGLVKHKTVVEINERGTEAAAGTGATVATSAAPEERFMKVDRPFLVAIRDDVTGAVLFLGAISDPQAPDGAG